METRFSLFVSLRDNAGMVEFGLVGDHASSSRLPDVYKRQAMSVLSAQKIDLMFVDINMPDLNGMDFVRSLTESRWLSSQQLIRSMPSKVSK